MSLIGSALGRGLAGAGAGAAAVANKYIDEELAADRANLLADIQHQSAVRLDQYQLGAERQATLRGNATAATMAQGQATRASELDGLNDAAYQGAKRSKADADAADATARDVKRLETMTPAEVAAANARLDGTMGAEAKRAGLIARATERERAAGANADVLRKVAQMEQVLGRKLTEDERLAAIGLAKAKGEDGLVKVEEEIDDGQGKKVKRSWKENPPKPPTEEEAHAEALDAIKAGALRQAVNAKLRQLGFAHLPAPEASGRRQAPTPGSADAVQSVPTQAIPGPAGAEIERAGQDLDAARAAKDEARTRYFTFGQRQRAANPAAFQQAEQAFKAAQHAEDQAEAAYQRLVWDSNFGGPRRMPRP